MSYAFASYNHVDSDNVSKIVKELHNKGFDIWMDRFDLLPGDNWSLKISDAVKKSSILLLFIGKGNVSSSWVQQEIYLMSQNKKSAIIPILLDGAETESLPEFIKNRLWIDARDEFDNAIERIATALLNYKVLPRKTKPDSSYDLKNSGYFFISYATTNTEFLAKIKSFLKDQKLGYWDFHENKRNYQVQFHLELEGAIKDSRAVVCLVTNAWKYSQWAPREYLFSQEIKKPIFLLKTEPVEPTLLIAGSSYINFVDDEDWAFAELKRELSTIQL
jgi:TIR domain